jgi:hypothetical protein
MTTAASPESKSGTATAGPSLVPEQACDLVMKGGITSGVIYPKLIHELSKHYRFKNVGGTSAGAIAAAGCAAAEYGRQHGRPGAFDKLSELPGELAKPVGPSQRSRLLSLFQPHKDLLPHFTVLLRALNQEPRPAIVGMAIRILANHAGLVLALLLLCSLLFAPVIGSLATSIPWGVSVGLGAVAMGLVGSGLWLTATAAESHKWRWLLGWLGMYVLLATGLHLATGSPWRWGTASVALSILAISLLMWALIVALAGFRFASSLLEGLHRNRYGLCSGRTTSVDTELTGLTDWLTDYFDDLAGVASRDHPLTFSDLWGGNDPGKREVNLEVMTSAVSQQMVYSIPLRDGAPYLYYDPDELKDYFPKRVTDWLAQVADTDSQARADGHRTDGFAPGTVIQFGKGTDVRILRPFPRGPDLPVVVAVRMSLSFPILLSAVPLYAIDFSLKANQAQKEVMREVERGNRSGNATFVATRIWFSDGGIGSNMPLHMFDALLPGHPTFAVNLKPEHPDFPITTPEINDDKGGRVYLPERNAAGHLRYWAAPDDKTPFGGLKGFLLSIIDTMQNWRDEIQFPHPGYRDRIIQISQRKAEGGLNLDMPEPLITALGDAGAMAAQRLVDRFHPTGGQAGEGWTNHQKVRLSTFLGTMQPATAALGETLASGQWTELLDDIPSYRTQERETAKAFISGLEGLAALGERASLDRPAYKPLAQVRIMPRV